MGALFGIFGRKNKKNTTLPTDPMEDEATLGYPSVQPAQGDDEATIGYASPASEESPVRFSPTFIPDIPYVTATIEPHENIDLPNMVPYDPDEDEGTMGLDAGFSHHMPPVNNAPEAFGSALVYEDPPAQTPPSSVYSAAWEDDERTIGYAAALKPDDEQSYRQPASPQDAAEGEDETVAPQAYLRQQDGEETVAPYAKNWQPPLRMVLVIDGPDGRADKIVTFTQEMEIGRDPQCALHLPQGYVSRHHIRFTVAGGAVCAVNLTAAKTGEWTLLNHSTLGTVPQKLRTGDRLQIHDIIIQIQSISVVS